MLVPEACLVLHLDSEEQAVRVTTLAHAFRRFVHLLNTLRDLVPQQKLDWLVKDLGKGSVHLAVSPIAETVVGERICYIAEDGLAALENGNLNACLPEDTIRAAKALAELAYKTKTRMVVSGPRRRVQLTLQTAKTADQILHAFWEDLGSVEGRLEMVTVHEKNQFNVYDELTGHCICCYFKPELLEKVKAGLKKRVSVSGLIRYAATGRLAQVVAESIDVLSDDSKLPSIEEMIGVAPNITNGLPLEDYLRRLKDEW
ncbi:MAG TPA: hypothetical protein GXX40_05505 [Firmicutes bacterium]|nr:hypothetical protein [Bacillota bacterium]